MIRCATQAACRRAGAKRVRGMRIQVRDGGEFSCEVTGFHGYEQEILSLRNANRDEPETLAYLDWRYRRSADSPEPQVFWLLTPERQRIGMASVVFRPYWSNNTRVQTAVVGDISLDTRWRGRGLGQALLRFMTEYLDVHFPQQPAFVIPTEAARRALSKVGWVTSGTLVQTWSIYDLAARTPAHLRAMLTLFVQRALAAPDLVTLRVTLDQRHPCRTHLRTLGFIARRHDAVFQVHSHSGTAERLAWCVTQGDKDT